MQEPSVFLCPEITREHARHLITWLTDREVRRFLSDGENTPESIRQALDRSGLPVVTHLFCQGGRFFMAFDRQDRAVGFVRLIPQGEDMEIVVVIGDRNRWGRKLGSSVIRESLRMAFFELRARRVIARIHRENRRSVRVFLRHGFSLQDGSGEVQFFSLTMEEYMERIRETSSSSPRIRITETDREKLTELIESELQKGLIPAGRVLDLQEELEKATVVEPQRVPEQVVTMNTRVLIRVNDEPREIKLVYPRDAGPGNLHLSVLSPVGTAILGYREGDRIRWKVPSGTASIRIEKILYQPESAGDYHL